MLALRVSPYIASGARSLWGHGSYAQFIRRRDVPLCGPTDLRNNLGEGVQGGDTFPEQSNKVDGDVLMVE